ncbi:quinone-oxidoreductase like chloroplastic [Fusarium albosuccineum]|uniref:Quinone-oxidoreductase like chloroplastic n=1 Tax=Fusarium albosuccineum TaxID=1237068 RepID=A0A8H4L9F9_9HYPO|nr:quinone-oxidoreductase like chloroplastic [Fusarium albosuccineum]
MASIKVPATMKAVLQPDKKSHKLILSEQPVPSPSHPEDVLVKVHATAPCKGELDWALWAPDFIGDDKVPIPGQDLAGTVVTAPAAGGFKTGDEVYARIEANRPGAAAEYVLARVSELAIRPKSLSWAETAATPISALTAYQSLFTKGTLDPWAVTGDTAARDKNAKISVLITAGAGGVGSWAVQLAKAAGVKTLVAVVGPKNLDFARELGATEVIDYTKQSIGDWVSENPDSRKIDLVFDCIGGSSLTQSWYAVREGGSLISVCAVPEENRPQDVETEAHSLWFVITPLGKDLSIISELLGAGKLKPTIDSIVPFDQFAEAWDKVESGGARGKVIVQVSDEMQ